MRPINLKYRSLVDVNLDRQFRDMIQRKDGTLKVVGFHRIGRILFFPDPKRGNRVVYPGAKIFVPNVNRFPTWERNLVVLVIPNGNSNLVARQDDLYRVDDAAQLAHWK